MHYNKALKCFQNVAEPDYENAIKEAVCAVEAAAQVLFSSDGKNLDDIIDAICFWIIYAIQFLIGHVVIVNKLLPCSTYIALNSYKLFFG